MTPSFSAFPTWVTLLVMVGACAASAQQPTEFPTNPALPGPYSIDSGNHIIVLGAPTAPGGVLIYERANAGAPWQQTALLRPPDLPSNARFGTSVRVSLGRVLVSAPYFPGSPRGRAYVFRKDGSEWVQEAVFTPEGDIDLDYYGSTIALDEGHAFVGTYLQGEDGPYGGGYFYRLVGNEWVRGQGTSNVTQARIQLPLAAVGNGGGTSVATWSGSSWVFAARPAEPVEQADGVIALATDRMIRGSTFFAQVDGQWRRLGRLQGGSITDARGDLALSTSSINGVTSFHMYQPDPAGLGWGYHRLLSYPGSPGACSLTPFHVVCATSTTVRVFDIPPRPDVLPAPAPIAPANGIAVQDTVNFSWAPVPGAESYTLEYAHHYEDFISRNTRVSGLTGTSYTVGGLLPGRSYYWHVHAVTASAATPWSPTQTFFTVEPPTLQSPASGAQFSNPPVVFRWSAAAHAESYRLQIATSNTFETIIVDQPVAGTTVTVGAPPLQRGVSYRWRIGSVYNGGGLTVWSTIRAFIINQIPPPAPTVAPVLLAPPNGAEGVPRTPTFVWRSVPHATSYLLRASYTPDFSTLAISSTSPDTTRTPSSPLDPGRTVYWFVTASNVTGTGPPSPIFSFITGAVTGLDDGVPETLALDAGPNPSLAAVTLRLAMPQAAHVRMAVYDVLGREVAVLIEDQRPAGFHSLTWGQGWPSGVYVVRAQVQSGEAPSQVLVRSVTLTR